MKNIINEKVVVNEFGELVSAELQVRKIIKSSDEFMQVYLEDMSVLMNIDTMAEFKVLVWLWKSSNYIDENVNLIGNQVIVNQRLVDIISREADLKAQTIRSTVSKLCKKRLILKDLEYRGVYYMNPQYFFKGALSDRLKKIRVINNYVFGDE